MIWLTTFISSSIARIIGMILGALVFIAPYALLLYHYVPDNRQLRAHVKVVETSLTNLQARVKVVETSLTKAEQKNEQSEKVIAKYAESTRALQNAKAMAEEKRAKAVLDNEAKTAVHEGTMLGLKIKQREVVNENEECRSIKSIIDDYHSNGWVFVKPKDRNSDSGSAGAKAVR